MREEGRRGTTLTTIQENFKDGSVEDTLHSPLSVRDQVVRGDLVGEEGIVESAGTASINEEGNVSSEVETSTDTLSRDGGGKGEVGRSRVVRGRDVGDIDLEVDRLGVEVREIDEDGTIAQ